MKASTNCLCILINLLFVFTAYSGEENDIRLVKTTGSAVIAGSNVEGAKKAAILDAKRNAVEQIGSQVVSQTVVENFALVKDKIILKLDGYVHHYKIVDERQAGSNYTVTIEAGVSKKELADDATMLYHDMDKPRLMVILPEIQGNELIPASHSEDVVNQFFVEKGFTLIDQGAAKANLRKDELRKIAEGDMKAAAKIGLRSGAEVVFVGTASLGEAESYRGILYGSKATVSLRALRTDNASLYAVSSITESAADGIADAAQRKAVDMAGKAVAKDMFWRVVKKWNDERNRGGDIELVMTGVSFSVLKKISEALKGFQGVSAVIQRSFDHPAAVFTVTYLGDANRLAELLSDASLPGLRLIVQSVSAGKINIHVKEK